SNYARAALEKATNSVPRILTLNGDQIVKVMVEHQLGLKVSQANNQRFDIDPDYFAAFEAMKSLLSGRVRESSPSYNAASSPFDPNASTDEQTIDLNPEEDLISLNALGYALRVDPTRVRRWVENETIKPDVAQISGAYTNYYFRRDRIEQIRKNLGLGNI